MCAYAQVFVESGVSPLRFFPETVADPVELHEALYGPRSSLRERFPKSLTRGEIWDAIEASYPKRTEHRPMYNSKNEKLLRVAAAEWGLDPRGLGDAGCGALAAVLRVNTALQTLYLGRNQITDAGAGGIAAALRENKSLRTLCLHYNQITDAGAGELAAALRENTALQTLYLGSNPITDAGAFELAAALRENTALQTLCLFYNQITDAGAVQLRDAWGDRKPDALSVNDQD